ncbi:MAG: DUF418 domain-containing protein [Cohaesibacteraceae bacterium]|nr:DUF418 domain-containing protein [Cohaesibacteraceae bacterium]
MNTTRLDGLDFARFLAFVGMLIVNFKLTLGMQTDNEWLVSIVGIFDGKAAACFVILAGLGLGLSARRFDNHIPWTNTFKKVVFLATIGLANAILFPPDILHYYAVYFLLGAFCLRFANKTLIILILVMVVIQILMLLLLDYEAGWEWSTLTYLDFWTLNGFVRNLLYNGWHPVIPWFGFFLFGIFISRLDLQNRHVLHALFRTGLISILILSIISFVAARYLIGNELELIASLSPIPPQPLYMAMGFSSGVCLIGGILLVFQSKISRPVPVSGVLKTLSAAGRFTLTFYVAHIYIGMGLVEELGYLGKLTLEQTLVATLFFCSALVLFSIIWSKYFKYGPVEGIMRRLCN